MSPVPRTTRKSPVTRSPARCWSLSVETIYRRRQRFLAAGSRLLWGGRVHTLRLSPGHIQGFIFTRDSRFVLVNIRLAAACSDHPFTFSANDLEIACSEKAHPGFSRFAAATLLSVARELRQDRSTIKRIFPTVATSSHAGDDTPEPPTTR